METLPRVYLDFLLPLLFLIFRFSCKYGFVVTFAGGSHGGSRGGRRVQQPDRGWVREPRRVSVSVIPPHSLRAVVLVLRWRSRLVYHSLCFRGLDPRHLRHLRLRSLHDSSEFSIGLMCAFALWLVFLFCYFQVPLLIIPMDLQIFVFP